MSTDEDQFDYSSATVPKAALFIAADEPLLVYPSAAAAAAHLETIDVENGVYPAAYGPLGEPYRVRAVDNKVLIERTGEAERPHELKRLLLRYLHRETEEAASLEALVAEVWKIESDFWQEHDPFGERFGTPVPVWGCFAFMLVLGAAFYLAFR